MTRVNTEEIPEMDTSELESRLEAEFRDLEISGRSGGSAVEELEGVKLNGNSTTSRLFEVVRLNIEDSQRQLESIQAMFEELERRKEQNGE